MVRCIEDKHYSRFAVPDIQLNLLCKNWIANCSCKHTMSQVREKAEKKVTNLTAIPITEGFLLQCSWHQELVKHTIPWPDDSESATACKRHPKTVSSREWCYKRNCGLMIPPWVMGLQSLLAHSLVTLAGTIHPATHTWRFEKKVGGATWVWRCWKNIADDGKFPCLNFN